jgi:hypothetical protein
MGHGYVDNLRFAVMLAFHVEALHRVDATGDFPLKLVKLRGQGQVKQCIYLF